MIIWTLAYIFSGDRVFLDKHGIAEDDDTPLFGNFYSGFTGYLMKPSV